MKMDKKRKPSLTLGLVSDEGGLVLHHRVDGQLLVVLGRDDGHGGLVGARLHGHVLHHLHLCERRNQRGRSHAGRGSSKGQGKQAQREDSLPRFFFAKASIFFGFGLI